MTHSSSPFRATTFQEPHFRKFEDRTYAHLNKYFPRHCQMLGEGQIRFVIRDGWNKAADHGLTEERCRRSFIEFMCLLGSGFTTDTLLPWASKILNDQAVKDQIIRMDRLYDRAWEYINHVAKDYRNTKGEPITARFVEDLRQLRRESREILSDEQFPKFVQTLAHRLKNTFPAKYDYVGQERIQNLISRARIRAKVYGITSERGIMVFTAHMFVLGGGFDRDLLIPWVSKVLKDSKITNQHQRVNQLLTASVTTLRKWWNSAGDQKG